MSLPRIAILGFVGSLTLGLAACGNDRSTPTSPTPLQLSPDLVVTSPSVSDSNPAPDMPFTLSVTARNDGDGAAAATTLRYYQSTDTTITTADTVVGTNAVAGLAASGSSSESVELSAPSTAGAYYYGACVDAVAEESDTTNNCSSSVTVMVAPAPASTLTGISFVDAGRVVEVGETVTLHVCATYSDDSEDCEIAPEWRSSALDVATVSETGVVTGVSPGSVEIIATYERLTATASITVKGPSFTLSGTVRDGRRTPGFVLPGAGVRLENGESTTTGPDGRYRFLNVSGAITVTAIATNYVAQTVEVTVDADRTLDFNLEHMGIPPFEGTVWITPNIIDSSDPTSLRSVTYAGRGMREFWDSRTETWVTINCYLFDVRYAGRQLEFQVNPEFRSREAAAAEVDTYAPALGRLPAVLLSRTREVEISATNVPAAANAALGVFHIYTGFTKDVIRDGFFEEMFIHEGGHVALDSAHANSTGWRAAQEADGTFISTYARDYPDREDIAESIAAYFAVRYRPERLTAADRSTIVTTIPNRLAYFEEQRFDMSPYTATGSIVPGRGVSSVEPTRGRWRPFEGPPIR